MALSDETKRLLHDKIRLLDDKNDYYQVKVAEINEVIFGLREIMRSSPKQVDCTDMTDDQIETSKTNLLAHVERILA